MTSYINALGLGAEYYAQALHWFHGSSFQQDELSHRWGIWLSEHPSAHRLREQLVYVGDGIKVSKEGRHVPGVKRLHQESENVSKAEWIRGHYFSALGVPIGWGDALFAAIFSLNWRKLRKHPQKYRFRVKLLASLGYAYIIFLLALLLGSTVVLFYFGLFFPMQISQGFVNAIFILLSIIALAISLSVIKSLKVYFPKPKGLELTCQKAPELFQFIDKLTSTLQASRCDRILLTAEFNAGVVQLTSPFKLQTNYLILGLPLMCALSLEQFRAVLAHELGHLSCKHSQYSLV